MAAIAQILSAADMVKNVAKDLGLEIPSAREIAQYGVKQLGKLLTNGDRRGKKTKKGVGKDMGKAVMMYNDSENIPRNIRNTEATLDFIFNPSISNTVTLPYGSGMDVIRYYCSDLVKLQGTNSVNVGCAINLSNPCLMFGMRVNDFLNNNYVPSAKSDVITGLINVKYDAAASNGRWTFSYNSPFDDIVGFNGFQYRLCTAEVILEYIGDPYSASGYVTIGQMSTNVNQLPSVGTVSIDSQIRALDSKAITFPTQWLIGKRVHIFPRLVDITSLDYMYPTQRTDRPVDPDASDNRTGYYGTITTPDRPYIYINGVGLNPPSASMSSLELRDIPISYLFKIGNKYCDIRRIWRTLDRSFPPTTSLEKVAKWCAEKGVDIDSFVLEGDLVDSVLQVSVKAVYEVINNQFTLAQNPNPCLPSIPVHFDALRMALNESWVYWESTPASAGAMAINS